MLVVGGLIVLGGCLFVVCCVLLFVVMCFCLFGMLVLVVFVCCLLYVLGWWSLFFGRRCALCVVRGFGVCWLLVVFRRGFDVVRCMLLVGG